MESDRKSRVKAICQESTNYLRVIASTAVAMSGYQAVSSLTAAAIRLALIGAIEAQRLIAGAMPLIQDSSAAAVEVDEPIRSFIPLAEVAVALHGASGRRLFSN